jgi:hypothetical protein
MTVDALIARALCADAPWPDGTDAGTVQTRAVYHGGTGLLMARVAQLAGWPNDLLSQLRGEALAQTMWEVRHRSILVPLLTALDAAGVQTVLLKGTALAYGLYQAPAQRSRGDTDLLVIPDDLERARDVLRAQGFMTNLQMAELNAPERQESWIFTAPDGGRHEVDLHVDVFSSPAVQYVLQGAEAQASAVSLSALCPAARTLPAPLALLHACVHRAQHVVSPYSVAGEWHYGADRLIWLMDIDLLMRAMTGQQFTTFQTAATQGGVGSICAAALRMAAERLSTPCPEGLITTLECAPSGPAAHYLLQNNSLGRVVEDLAAIPGLRGKLHHAALRLFPPADTLRSRYPDLADAAPVRLYVRRLSGVLTRRGGDNT